MLLSRISSFDLHLVASHPDRAGGLKFMGAVVAGYRLPAFAFSVIVAGSAAARFRQGVQIFDIGFLAAGGGGSMAAMDALMQWGGSPANYAEHSGDPPREKVYALAKAILSKPNLSGLWIVGAIANFTRIDQTMQGIIDALIEFKPKFPIVVRRSGPYEKEGLQMLKDAAALYNLDVEVHGSETAMTATAKTMAEKSKLFKEEK